MAATGIIFDIKLLKRASMGDDNLRKSRYLNQKKKKTKTRKNEIFVGSKSVL